MRRKKYRLARYLSNSNYVLAKCSHCPNGLFRDKAVRAPICFECKMAMRRLAANRHYAGK